MQGLSMFDLYELLMQSQQRPPATSMAPPLPPVTGIPYTDQKTGDTDVYPENIESLAQRPMAQQPFQPIIDRSGDMDAGAPQRGLSPGDLQGARSDVREMFRTSPKPPQPAVQPGIGVQGPTGEQVAAAESPDPDAMIQDKRGKRRLLELFRDLTQASHQFGDTRGAGAMYLNQPGITPYQTPTGVESSIARLQAESDPGMEASSPESVQLREMINDLMGIEMDPSTTASSLRQVLPLLATKLAGRYGVARAQAAHGLARSKEQRQHLRSIKKDFRSDPEVKTLREHIRIAQQGKDLLESGNPIGAEAAKNLIARTVGQEKGPLSDADRAVYGLPGWRGVLSKWTKRIASDMSSAERDELMKLLVNYERGLAPRIHEMALSYGDTYADEFGASPEEFANELGFPKGKGQKFTIIGSDGKVYVDATNEEVEKFMEDDPDARSVPR